MVEELFNFRQQMFVKYVILGYDNLTKTKGLYRVIKN